ncbi:MAG: ribosome maturation factor RimP [Rhodoferax sp.]
MSLQELVEQTVKGLGYDLVEVERSAGGLLRVTIDWPWSPEAPALDGSVTVEDCERVTRQLQYVLEVESVDYRRLEVSSPGIDRPLRDARDFERFVGEMVDITLKSPIGSAAQGQVSANRKKFRGILERAHASPEAEPAWQVVWRDEPDVPAKRSRSAARRQAESPLQALVFVLNDVKEARLAPIVNFKGRSRGSRNALPGAPVSPWPQPE